MERGQVLGLKEYFQNVYTTQGNVEIQCKPYQIINGIFRRIRQKNLKICMEPQKIPNRKTKLEKEK